MSHKPITVFRLRIVLGRIIGIVHGVEKNKPDWKLERFSSIKHFMAKI